MNQSSARRILTGVLVSLAVALAGCGGASSSAPAPSAAGTGSPGTGPRPSSPASVRIVSPANGEAVTGSSVHVVLTLSGATIVTATTTKVRPDEGHIHLYVNNVLTSMNYQLEQDLAVHPGTYVLKAEFVAADHAPFSPRIWSPEVFFTVK